MTPAFAALALLAAWATCASTPEERAIESIRREAQLTAAGRDGWRLPLAASWNDGENATGWSPAWQLEQIGQGGYLLPWFGLSIPPLAGAERTPNAFPDTSDTPYYYEGATRYLAKHHLPLSFETTQWERVLPLVSAAYARHLQGGQLAPLSPFDPVDGWYAAGRSWARHPTLVRMQRLYPDPPLVLFISNNEQPKRTPDELAAGYRADAPAQLAALRRAIGDAWIRRYRALQRGFRDGLIAPAWRAHARFVGYDAFVTPALGRWSGWPAYSLYVPGRTEPWPYAWDGASVSYYLHDWASDADDIVMSPQIEAMNYYAPLAEVRGVDPDFWFELSVWDGQQPGQAADKLAFYAARGQQFTPERYAGMVQFGMWLLRPRVVREFRNGADDRVRLGRYFGALLAAVARVHDDPLLAGFWRSGRLLQNPAAGHPYEVDVPQVLGRRPRWFLLDSSANPPRPWELTTPLRLYSLALERGAAPRREWLIYAFSPRDARLQAEVRIPGGPPVQVQATVAGAFTWLRETDGTPRAVATAALTP